MTTNNISNLTDAKIYVGTYKKYNDGSLFGKWLDLSDYADKEDFLQACAELHKDEEDPEFMFQDWANIPDCFIAESYINEKIFDLVNRIDEITNISAFEAFMDWVGYDLEKKDFDELKSEFEEAFCGEYDSEEDYAREDIKSNHTLDEFAANYFDYSAYARDLFISDYYYSDGYVFENY